MEVRFGGISYIASVWQVAMGWDGVKVERGEGGKRVRIGERGHAEFSPT